jgi:two-component system NtrC family sensor kinase
MRSALERRRLAHGAAQGDVAAVRAAGNRQGPLYPSAGPQQVIPRLAPLARMASVGRLAGGMAHEVNNLLCALCSQLQVLQLHEGLDPELPPTLEAMERWVRRAAASVGSLLEYALRPPGMRSRVDLHAVTSRMLTLLQESARFRHLQMSTDFAPPLPLVEVDEAAWEQVVFELTANAAEAISAHGSLRVRTRQCPGNCLSAPRGGIEVVFEDDGPGIPAELVPRLFEAFFTTKPEGEHAGLGLTIVQSILMDHQGDIRVEPNQPSGTRVIIRLPAPHPQPN